MEFKDRGNCSVQECSVYKIFAEEIFDVGLETD
jgi:hypothetical protein